MGLLDRERTALDTFMPGLDEFLSSTPLMELEGPHSKGIAAFRDHGGAALLVPAEHSGRGATALEAVRVQRAIGSRSPSLAVATTMHHFSVASLVALSEVRRAWSGCCWRASPRNHLLVASGFAEGRPGGGILPPDHATPRRPTRAYGSAASSGPVQPGQVDGPADRERPGAPAGRQRRPSCAVALIPAASDGHRASARSGARSRWPAPRATRSASPTCSSPPSCWSARSCRRASVLDDVQTAGFLWFELLMIGLATSARQSGSSSGCWTTTGCPRRERARLVIDLEGAWAAVREHRPADPGPPARPRPAGRLVVRPLRRAGRHRPCRATGSRAARRAQLHQLRRRRLSGRRSQRARLSPAVAHQDVRPTARLSGRRTTRDRLREHHENRQADLAAHGRRRRPRPGTRSTS